MVESALKDYIFSRYSRLFVNTVKITDYGRSVVYCLSNITSYYETDILPLVEDMLFGYAAKSLHIHVC